jgi:hypothetical protein
MITYTTNDWYDLRSKIVNIKQAQDDFFAIYHEHIQVPHTNKPLFYFIAKDGKKYVHKHSLRFIYSNRDTFTLEDGVNYCKLTQEFTPLDIVSMLEAEQIPFFPRLLDTNEYFLVYEYVDGELMQDLTNDDYQECKALHQSCKYTPFYNSINDNLIRTPSGIKLIDFKQLDPVDPTIPFYVYLRYTTSNQLHVDAGTPTSDIVSFLAAEFSVDNLTIVEH